MPSVTDSTLSNEFQKNTKLVCEPEGGEERSLEHYETWMKRRKNIYAQLGRRLKREPGNLLMNLADEIKLVFDEKTYFEATKWPFLFDKYRGNPAFWYLPYSLNEPCSIDKTYFAQKTKEQKVEIPSDILQVGIPKAILEEKGILPRIRDIYTRWKNSKYRREQLEHLTYYLERIKPHIPEFEKLVIIGEKKKIYEEAQHDKLQEGDVEYQVAKHSPTKPRLQMVINGMCFGDTVPLVSPTTKMRILFDYDMKHDPLATQYITFKNEGTAAVRIYWKEFKKFKLFEDLGTGCKERAFFFNKNELLVLPDSEINFPIWFRPSETCYEVERWEIYTSPSLWNENHSLIFILQGNGYVKGVKNRIEQIKRNTIIAIRDRIISEVFQEIKTMCSYRKLEPIPQVYTEKDMFEGANIDILDIERRPKYIYNETIINELNEFYCQIRQSHHPLKWTYSIKELKEMAREKDILVYVSEKTEHKRNIRHPSEHGSPQTKGSAGGDKPGSPKKGASKIKVKTVTTQSKSTANIVQEVVLELKSTYASKLNNILNKLERPSVFPNLNRLKYFYAYSIFCSYFNTMSWDLQRMHDDINMKYGNTTKENEIQPDRIIFEYFDDLYVRRLKRVRGAEDEEIKAFPKPARLRDISLDDPVRLHSAYHGKSSKDKTSKGSGSKDIKPVKSTKGITPFSPGMGYKEFDPYIEPFIRTKTITPPSKSSIRSYEEYDDNDLTPGINARQNMYVLVHFYLGQAIDAVTEMLETLPEYKIPPKDIESARCYIHEADTEKVASAPFESAEDIVYYNKLLAVHDKPEIREILVKDKLIARVKDTAVTPITTPATSMLSKKLSVIEEMEEEDTSRRSTLGIKPQSRVTVRDKMGTKPKEVSTATTRQVVKTIDLVPTSYGREKSPEKFVMIKNDEMYYSEDEIFAEEITEEEESVHSIESYEKHLEEKKSKAWLP